MTKPREYEGYVLTYAQCRLIIWNPQAYASNIIREAAIEILSGLSSKREDVDQATLCL